MRKAWRWEWKCESDSNYGRVRLRRVESRRGPFGKNHTSGVFRNQMNEKQLNGKNLHTI